MIFPSALLLLGAFLPNLATAIPTLVPRGRNVQDDFVGRGQIHVLNSSSYVTADPAADTIGCLTSTGLLSATNCATFTRTDTYPHVLISSRGVCNFLDKSMPNNKDSFYGKNTYAWHCAEKNVIDYYGETYYSINGFKHPYICNGNLGCYYDIPAAPQKAPKSEGDNDESVAIQTIEQTKSIQPVWQFFWGSHQMGITPGHLQVLWLWVPVSE